MKKINLILIITFFFHSCGGFKEAGKVLRNEKIGTTDEFLVKKKEPLVLPPDYNELPKPGSIKINEAASREEKLKKILKVDKENKISSKKNSSIEKSILNEIKK